MAEVGFAVAIVRQSSWAAKASTVLLPFELVYWTGFAQPFGFVFGLGRISCYAPTGRTSMPGQKGLSEQVPVGPPAAKPSADCQTKRGSDRGVTSYAEPNGRFV